jgi:hypothetical protein
MSSLWLHSLPFQLIILTSLLLGKVFDARFPRRWWLLRLGLLPLISLGLACYVIAVPTTVPDDYKPLMDGNPKRLDWAAILVYGIVLPTIYSAVAVPAFVSYALWKRRASTPPRSPKGWAPSRRNSTHGTFVRVDELLNHQQDLRSAVICRRLQILDDCQ